MNCRKVQEEFVVVFCQEEAGTTLRIAIRQQVETCPDCQQRAAVTHRMVAIVRTRCSRSAPQTLLGRILSCLPHRTRPEFDPNKD